jgi:hypothetical protein
MKAKKKTVQSKTDAPVARPDNQTDLFPVIRNKLVSIIVRYDFLVLFILLFIIFNTVSSLKIPSGDVGPASLLPFCLIYHHNFYFDFFSTFAQSSSYSYAYPVVNGHYVSLFPIVTPVLITPVYGISVLFSHVLSIPLTPDDFFILPKTSAAIISAVSASVFYLTAKELFLKRTALITTFIFALATSTWSVSSRALWQHGTVELLLILLIYVIVRNERRESFRNIIVLGIISGLFIFNRPPDAILLIPVIFYVFWYMRSKAPWYILGGIAGGFPFLIYNISIFGNIFGGYKENIKIFVLSLDFVRNYIGLLVAPNVGLLIFSPVLILSIFGFLRIREINNMRIRHLLLLFGPVIALQILLYSFFEAWFSSGGYNYGPRFLTGFIPVLCLFIGLFLDGYQRDESKKRTRWITTTLLTVLIVSSVIIQCMGVFFYPYVPEPTMNKDRVWDWNDTIIAESFNAGKNIESLTLYTLPPFPPVFSWQLRPKSADT